MAGRVANQGDKRMTVIDIKSVICRRCHLPNLLDDAGQCALWDDKDGEREMRDAAMKEALGDADFYNVFQAKTAFDLGFHAGWNAHKAWKENK